MNPDFLQRIPGFDWSVCERVLAGEGSPDERTRVLAWFAQAPELHALVAGMRAGAVSMGDDDATVRAVRQRIAQGVAAPTLTAEPVMMSERGRRTGASATVRPFERAWRWPSAIAAAALFAVGGWAVAHRAPSQPSTAESYTTYSTTRGQRSSVTLRDGTRVTLSVASTLRVPNDFGTSGRRILLDGEAYFDVAHDGGVPFIVQSGGAQAVVLGTSFGVRKYPDDVSVRVAVASGRVRVDSVVLNGGDVARWVNGRTSVMRDVRIGQYVGWMSGRLAYENVPLRTVLTDLSRWYDVRMECDPQIADEAVSTVIVNRSADDAARALAVLFGLEVRHTGDTIQLVRPTAK